jgi:hypothetical protein
MYEHPKDAFNRRFTVANTKRRLKNKEEVKRPWLVYSAIKMLYFDFAANSLVHSMLL